MIEAVVTADGRPTELSLDDASGSADPVWVRVTNATGDELDRVAEAFGIHPLALEDLSGVARTKTEEYADYTFVLLETAELTPGETSFDEELLVEPIGLYIGDGWLVTLSHGSTQAGRRTWRAVTEKGRLLGRGPDLVASRIVDGIVEEYFSILDALETEIEAVEDAVLETTEIATLERINSLRRELLQFRKLVWPAREAVGTLARGDPEHVQPATEKYFRDVYDRLILLVELTETYRDLVSGARDIYLNTVSRSTNEVMKRLTVVATIVLPLTFVAGVYGMNFEVMPELGWAWGYPAAMLGMAGVTVVLVAHFHRRNYL